MDTHPISRGKLQKSCIFCETKTGLSREHIFADWMKKSFPSDSPNHFVVQKGKFSFLPDQQPHPFFSRRRKQGRASNMTVKAVCRTCNNEWMSRIEERSKELLTRLMTSQIFVLGVRDQELLATWLSLKTVVHDSRETNAVPQRHRSFIFKNGRPPDEDWQIFIGRTHSDPGKVALFQFACRRSWEGINAEGYPPTLNTQSTLMVAGGLVGFCVSSPGGTAKLELTNPALTRIWPLGDKPIQWPPLLFLNPWSLDRLGTVLTRIPGATYEG